MKISIQKEYKSLNNLEWENIPTFSVLTGANGVGKSQLLELIYSKIMDSHKFPQIFIHGIKLEVHEINYVRDWNLSNTPGTNLANHQQQIKQEYEIFRNFNRRNTQYQNNQNAILFNQIFLKLNYANPRDVPIEQFESIRGIILAGQQDLSKSIESLFYHWRLKEINARDQRHSEEKIVQELGAKPWEILAKILQQTNLDFEFNNPEKMNVTGHFKLTVFNKKSGKEINLQDLSSGEKTIISIILYVYRSRLNYSFFKLILLDEPDAHLHPGMSEFFIKAIKEVLVDQYGLRVIMTTHSPCTVLLCPLDSVFIMEKQPTRIFKAKSLNEAVSTLTDGVLYISNVARYVLVEAKFDKEFYNILYQNLRPHLNKNIPLTFLPLSEIDKNLGGKNAATQKTDAWRSFSQLVNSDLVDFFFSTCR